MDGGLDRRSSMGAKEKTPPTTETKSSNVAVVFPSRARDISRALGDSKRDLKSNREILDSSQPPPSLASRRASFGSDSHFHMRFSETFVFFSSNAHGATGVSDRNCGALNFETSRPIYCPSRPPHKMRSWGRRKGYSRSKVCSDGGSHVV